MLDESFKSLPDYVYLSFDLDENDAKVIHTIAHHSSQIEALKIVFVRQTSNLAPLEKFGCVIQSLNLLNHLTNLTLTNLPESHSPILKFVGKSCPFLSTFSFLGSYTCNRDIAALFLGERVDQFFPMESDEDYDLSVDDAIRLEEMIVSTEMLTPICSTLQSLLFIEHEDNDLEPGLVFALRHLPQLRKVDMTSSLPEAIKLLYDSTAHLENAAQEPVTNSFLGRPTHFYVLIFA